MSSGERGASNGSDIGGSNAPGSVDPGVDRVGNAAAPGGPGDAPTPTSGRAQPARARSYKVAAVTGTPFEPTRSRTRGTDAEASARRPDDTAPTVAAAPAGEAPANPAAAEQGEAAAQLPVRATGTTLRPVPVDGAPGPAARGDAALPSVATVQPAGTGAAPPGGHPPGPGLPRIAPPPPPPASPRAASRRPWSARVPLLVGFACLILCFGGFGAWAWASRIAGAVVASGQVEVEQHRQVVQHLDGGIVDQILVREGDRVGAGQPLIRLDGALLKTELAIVQGQYFEILSRRGRLEAERSDNEQITFPEELSAAGATDKSAADLMEGQIALFNARRATLAQSLDQLDKQVEQTRAQIDGIDAQSQAFTKQRALIGEELTDAETLLAKGLAQAPRVLALQREAAGLDGQLGELTSTRAQSESKIIEIGIERLRLTAERREKAETELRELGYRELELAERRRSLTEQVARLEIRAPTAGIVHQLQVTTPRSVVRAAEPVMYIIPQDRPLVIAAHIAPINIDEVRVGQPVVLRFASFSSRTTPEIDGMLSQISPDAVADEATRQSYYRAEVSIPPDQMSKLGDLKVIPGMPVEVFVQTGERSPMAYLLKPLSDYFARAFRES